eukprot:PhM_4_TR10356/c0_g1_i1/m.80263
MQHELDVRQALSEGVHVPVERFLAAIEQMLGDALELIQNATENAPVRSSSSSAYENGNGNGDDDDGLFLLRKNFHHADVILRRVELLTRLSASAPLTNTDADWLNLAQMFDALRDDLLPAVEMERRGLRAQTLENLAFLARHQEAWEDARVFMEESVGLAAPRAQALLNLLGILGNCPGHERDILRHARRAIDVLEEQLQTLSEEIIANFVNASAPVRLDYHNRRTFTAKMLCVSHLHYAEAMDTIVRSLCRDAVLVTDDLTRKITCVTLCYADSVALAQKELGDDCDVLVEMKKKISDWSRWLSYDSPAPDPQDASMEVSLRWKMQLRRAKHFEALYNGGTLPTASEGHSPSYTWLGFVVREARKVGADVPCTQTVVAMYGDVLAVSTSEPRTESHRMPPPSNNYTVARSSSRSSNGGERKSVTIVPSTPGLPPLGRSQSSSRDRERSASSLSSSGLPPPPPVSQHYQQPQQRLPPSALKSHSNGIPLPVKKPTSATPAPQQRGKYSHVPSRYHQDPMANLVQQRREGGEYVTTRRRTSPRAPLARQASHDNLPPYTTRARTPTATTTSRSGGGGVSSASSISPASCSSAAPGPRASTPRRCVPGYAVPTSSSHARFDQRGRAEVSRWGSMTAQIPKSLQNCYT